MSIDEALTAESGPWAEHIFVVPFHDVDMLEVAWHGHYYKYFELVRTALFEKYHLDVPALKEMGYALVVSDSSCRYIHPLTYGMKVRAKAVITELEYRIGISYTLHEHETDRRLAKGKTVQVSLQMPSRSLRMATPEPIVAQFMAAAEGES